MSLLVNLSKSIAGYFSKGLAAAPMTTTTTVGNEVAEFGSGFTRWRSTYERFCRRKSKQNLMGPLKSSSSSKSSSKQGSSLDVRRRRSSLRLRCDRKGFNTASMLSNMRFARLFSVNSTHRISTHEDQHKIIAAGLPKKKRSICALPQHQSVRTKCGRENCADPCDWPMCPPFNCRWPAPHDNKLYNIYEAYWDTKQEDCCEDPCRWTHPHPRFDDIYLKESDKAKRRYMRTWTECPMRIKEKRICCYDGEPPEVCIRTKKERPHTACPPEPEICEGDDKKCQKIKMPCCCEVRKPQTCRPLVRGLAKCKKFCTPYPSFSECCKPKGKPKRPMECGCLNPVPMCEYWVYWRKRILSRSGEKC